jgi:hypothetical protein
VQHQPGKHEEGTGAAEEECQDDAKENSEEQGHVDGEGI